MNELMMIRIDLTMLIAESTFKVCIILSLEQINAASEKKHVINGKIMYHYFID